MDLVHLAAILPHVKNLEHQVSEGMGKMIAAMFGGRRG